MHQSIHIYLYMYSKFAIQGSAFPNNKCYASEPCASSGLKTQTHNKTHMGSHYRCVCCDCLHLRKTKHVSSTASHSKNTQKPVCFHWCLQQKHKSMCFLPCLPGTQKTSVFAFSPRLCDPRQPKTAQGSPRCPKAAKGFCAKRCAALPHICFSA